MWAHTSGRRSWRRFGQDPVWESLSWVSSALQTFKDAGQPPPNPSGIHSTQQHSINHDFETPKPCTLGLKAPVWFLFISFCTFLSFLIHILLTQVEIPISWQKNLTFPAKALKKSWRKQQPRHIIQAFLLCLTILLILLGLFSLFYHL